MKKLLSLLLVLTVLLASLSLFAACSNDEPADGGNGDGNGDGNGAAEQTDALADFFDLGLDFGTPLQAALSGGSMTVSLSGGKMLLGDEFGGFTQTLYFGKDGCLVWDMSVTLADTPFAALLAMDKNDKNIILKSAALLGSDTAYMISLSTFLEDLEASPFADLLGMTEEDYAALEEVLANAMKDTPAKTEEDLEKLLADLSACFPVVKGTASITLDGKSVAATTETYTVTKAGVKSALLKLAEYGGADSATLTELGAMLDEGIIDDSRDCVVYRDAASGKFLKAEVAYEYATEYYTENVAMILTLSDTKLYFSTSGETVWLDGEKESALNELTINKTVSGTSTTFALTMATTQDGEKDTAVSGSFTYDKATGAFTLPVTTDGETLTVAGTLTASATEAKLAVTSISMEDVTISLNASIIFRATATAPTLPTDAKNILKLTEAEIGTLMEEMQSAPLFNILMALFAGGDDSMGDDYVDDGGHVEMGMCSLCEDYFDELIYVGVVDDGYMLGLCDDCYEAWMQDNYIG